MPTEHDVMWIACCDKKWSYLTAYTYTHTATELHPCLPACFPAVIEQQKELNSSPSRFLLFVIIIGLSSSLLILILPHGQINMLETVCLCKKGEWNNDDDDDFDIKIGPIIA